MCTIMEKKIIQIQCQEGRYKYIRFICGTLGLNERVKMVVKTLPKEVLQFMGMLNHMAANLNQIAKKRNKGEDLNALDRALLNQEVRAIQEVVKDVKTYLE